jgi:hypothetical protein
MQIKLTPIAGGRPIELERELTVVGRLDECDLKLDDKSVSKLHCVLFCDGQQVLVRDLGSTNGTRVNGQRIRRASIATDDQLSIANCSFRVTVVVDKPLLLDPVPNQVGRNHNQTVRIEPIGRASPAPLPQMTGNEDNSDSVVLEAPPPLGKNQLPDQYPD